MDESTNEKELIEELLKNITNNLLNFIEKINKENVLLKNKLASSEKDLSQARKIVGNKEKRTVILGAIGNLNISEIGLQKRTFNALREANIKTVAELAEMSWFEIRKLRGIGTDSMRDIESYFNSEGLII